MSISLPNELVSDWTLLTTTASHTPMGRLLRRYWWPIAGASDLASRRNMPVRLLGEDFVLFRDLSDRTALVDRRCPHRGADLACGFVEREGIRCSYHGWLFGPSGRCVSAPYEDTVHPGFSERRNIALRSYAVRELGGLLWTYLGPEPVPELPDWEFFHWENGFKQIVISTVPCNWLQCQENSVDPVHFEWQHSNFALRASGQLGRYFPTHTALKFEEFPYGIVYKRLRSNSAPSDPLWTTGRVCLWPNALFTGNHVEYRVPIDDENTLSVGWFFDRVPRERDPYVQTTIPTWHAPLRDEKGWITTHIMNQDFMACVGQGRIADRRREHLGASDVGIALLRKRFMSDLNLLEESGADPKAVIRGSDANVRIGLPMADREYLIHGSTLDEMLATPHLCERLRGFVFQAGQPLEVREAFVDAMGIRDVTLPDPQIVDQLASAPSAPSAPLNVRS